MAISSLLTDQDIHPVGSIKALDPDVERRYEMMKRYALDERTYVCCLCQLIYRFHVPTLRVSQFLEQQALEGRFRKDAWPAELSHDDPECALYVAPNLPLNREQVLAVARVSSDIEFALGIMRECFPGYDPGLGLDYQRDPQIGERVRKALGAVVEILDGLRTDGHRVVPEYWSQIRLNGPAIVLTLRKVLGNPAEVRTLLRLVQDLREPLDIAMNDIRALVGQFERDAERLKLVTKTAEASLDEGIKTLQAALAR
jgi:hypothetical protein